MGWAAAVSVNSIGTGVARQRLGSAGTARAGWRLNSVSGVPASCRWGRDHPNWQAWVNRRVCLCHQAGDHRASTMRRTPLPHNLMSPGRPPVHASGRYCPAAPEETACLARQFPAHPTKLGRSTAKLGRSTAPGKLAPRRDSLSKSANRTQHRRLDLTSRTKLFDASISSHLSKVLVLTRRAPLQKCCDHKSSL